MFKALLHRELRYNYPVWFSWVSMIVNELIILAVFWYTAKAFVPSLKLFQGQEVSYFSFIVIGLSTIRIPTYLIIASVRKIKEARIEGVLESIQLLPRPITLTISQWSLIGMLTEVIRVVLILSLALTIFGLTLSFKSIAMMILIQLLAIPLFMGLGLIAASVYLRFGRGDALVAKLASLGGILSGAYFPTNVLPETMTNLLNIISPFNLILSLTRSSQVNFNSILILMVEGIIVLFVGFLLLHVSFESFKKRTPPLHVS